MFCVNFSCAFKKFNLFHINKIINYICEVPNPIPEPIPIPTYLGNLEQEMQCKLFSLWEIDESSCVLKGYW